MASSVERTLEQINKRLGALLAAGDQEVWVGGYVYGQTSRDDPFVILYPVRPELKYSLCRVYPHQFSKLPKFIHFAHDPDNMPADTEDTIDKEKAIRKRIYHECPPFLILRHPGRETSTGRENRFYDVLVLSKKAREAVAEIERQAAGQNGNGRPQGSPTLPPPQRPAVADNRSPSNGGNGKANGANSRPSVAIDPKLAGELGRLDRAAEKRIDEIINALNWNDFDDRVVDYAKWMQEMGTEYLRTVYQPYTAGRNVIASVRYAIMRIAGYDNHPISNVATYAAWNALDLYVYRRHEYANLPLDEAKYKSLNDAAQRFSGYYTDKEYELAQAKEAAES